MIVIYGVNKIRRFRSPVVALGVFDGVHRGHRRILQAAVIKARAIRGTSVAVTFWPHPQKEESLYSLEHRLRLFAELGVDVCVVINFNVHFSGISALDFIRNILVNKIGAKIIYVGKNYKFGKHAKGDYKTLKMEGGIYDFKVNGFEIIKFGGRPISSTLIRRLIKKGDLQRAQNLLGRRVSILGTVIRGSAVGRILGFPTANIDPHHEVIPPQGIYAVRIVLNNKGLIGACYIGKRPTLKLRKRKLNIEVYVINFKKNIYGKYIEVQFVKKLRSDKKFPSLALLSKQIKKDVISAKRILS